MFYKYNYYGFENKTTMVLLVVMVTQHYYGYITMVAKSHL